MTNKNLYDAGIYFLMREMLCNGSAGLDPDIEPISVDELILQLAKKSGNNFGDDKSRWVNWFVNDCINATSIEKDSIAITFRLLEAENKYLPRLESTR